MIDRIATVGLGALVLLGWVGTAPSAQAQERLDLTAAKFGPGAQESGVTINDTVRLTATLTGSGFSPTWLLRINRLDSSNQITGIVDCHASPCTADVRSTEAVTLRYQAILLKGADWAPIRSAPKAVVWARREATKLTLEVQGQKHVVFLNDKFVQSNSPPPLPAPTVGPINSKPNPAIPAAASVDFGLPSGFSLWIFHLNGVRICGPERLACTGNVRPPSAGFAAKTNVIAKICTGQNPCFGSGGVSQANVDIQWFAPP